jgi:hypothetical protein
MKFPIPHGRYSAMPPDLATSGKQKSSLGTLLTRNPAVLYQAGVAADRDAPSRFGRLRTPGWGHPRFPNLEMPPSLTPPSVSRDKTKKTDRARPYRVAVGFAL